MISLNKCNGSRNADDDLSLKICCLSETKDVNVKVPNMITRIHEAKILEKHIHCDCKFKFDITNLIKIKNGIMANTNVSVKSIVRAQRIVVGIKVLVFVGRVSI